MMADNTTNCKAYGFLAWTASDRLNLIDPLPFTKTANRSYTLNSAPLNSVSGSAPVAFYLAAMPNMMLSQSFGDHGVLPACQTGRDYAGDSFFADSTMIQCQVFNSTYRANFKFEEGKQSIGVRTSSLEDRPISAVERVYGPPPQPIAGSVAASPECRPFISNYNQTCLFSRRLVSTLSYQAIMEAFNKLLVGSVYVTDRSFQPNFNSAIQDTALVDTPELVFLTQSVVVSSYYGIYSLQDSIMSSNGTLFKGIYSDASPIPSKPLAQTTEEMFQNITISLMSSRTLQ